MGVQHKNLTNKASERLGNLLFCAYVDADIVHILR